MNERARWCDFVRSYEEGLDGAAVREALQSTDMETMLLALFKRPLERLLERAPMVLLLNALDELPSASKRAMLKVLATDLPAALPDWIRCVDFSTQRTIFPSPTECATHVSLARHLPRPRFFS